MVLQDLDTPQDSFDDNPYPTETDQYSSSPSGNRYDASDLAQPIPIFGPLLGFSERALRYRTESTIKFAERRINRSMTNDEAHALATHLYELEQSKSYLTTVGAGLGTWRWYTTMGKNRYPFYQPKPEAINPMKFMGIKGSMAQYARHTWRLTLYLLVAGQLGNLVGAVTAQAQTARDTAKDPRLSKFTAELKSSGPSESDRTRGAREQARADFQERTRRDRAARAAAERERQGDTSIPGAPPRKPWNVQKPTPIDDDMSPTAGNEAWPSSGDAWGTTDASSGAVQSASGRQQPDQATSSWGRSTQQSDSDSASPTGGSFQEEVQSQSRPGNSAWDRLRRGGAPGASQPRPPQDRRISPHKEQREGSTLGDSFTFAESDDERRRGQEQAQREFNARIEHERQGKDFNDEKRW